MATVHLLGVETDGWIFVLPHCPEPISIRMQKKNEWIPKRDMTIV
jgi:hypothetical protein